MITSRDFSDLRPRMRDWRHDFHQHPELAFKEVRTSEKVAALLREFGLEVTTGVAGTGVVASLRNGDGPLIGLRADMDALPIHEENGFKHASKTSGVMHACGHDGHMSMLLGAAYYLAMSPMFQGTVHFIFQPAEENEAGALAMIEDGIFNRFDCNAIYGLHNWPGLAVGHMEVCFGPIMAAFDTFDISVEGQGAHAAQPHKGRDTVLASADLIASLHGIVSRRVEPTAPAVVSVTKVSGGNTYNVLPARVELAGCTRHFDETTQNLIEKEILQRCTGLAAANGVEIVLDYQRRYPATVNTSVETKLAIIAAAQTVGADAVKDDGLPSLGSEDFSFMLKERPGCYIRIGNGPSEGGRALHSPTYDFCDDALTFGAAYWANLVPVALRAIGN